MDSNCHPAANKSAGGLPGASRPSPGKNGRNSYNVQSWKRRPTHLPKTHIMDKIARVLFPVMFLVMNIVYWVIFKALPPGTIAL